jgi:CRISPR/Cas system-associated exonuclease Cas4 (RecB family)
VCRLHRLDAQNPQHLEDPIWSLYALLAPAEALQGIEFRISYLADGSEQIFSVADNEERLDVHRKQIFAAARKIRRGHFEPKPKHLKMCHRCPYNLICPA